jgi:hypothetical protein
MARNTPIIINKHPAVVELLGENYPLYYQSDNYFMMNQEINELLANPKNILNAYKYLRKIDKKIIDIQTFGDEFISLIQNNTN